MSFMFKDSVDEIIKDLDDSAHQFGRKSSITHANVENDNAEPRHLLKPLKADGGGKKFTEHYLSIQACMNEKLLFTHRIFRYIKSSVIDDFPPVYLDLSAFRSKKFYPPKSLAEKILNETRYFDYYVMAPWYQRIMNFVKTHTSDVPEEKLPNLAELLNQFIKGLVLQFMSATINDVVSKFIDPIKTPLIHLCASYNDGNIVITPSYNKLLKYYAGCIQQVASIGKGWIHPEFYLIEGKQKERMSIKFLDKFIPTSQKLIIQNMKQFIEPTATFYENLALTISEVTPSKLFEGLHKCKTMDGLFDMITESLKNRKKLRNLSDNEHIGITRINQTNLKSALEAVLATQLHDIVTELIFMHIEDNFKLQKMFADIKERCVRVPKTTEELMALGKYMTYCSSTLMEGMRVKCLLTLKNVAKLSDLLILSSNHIRHISYTVRYYRSMPKAFKRFAQLFESTKLAMENRLHHLTEELNHSLEQFGSEYLEGLNNFDNLDKMFFYSQYLTKNVRLMETFDERVAFINKEESLFHIPSSTYPELDELKAIIYPFARLVLSLNKWMRKRKIWMKGPFENLKLSDIEVQIEEYLKLISLYHKQYKATCRMQALDQYPKRFKGTVDDPDFNLWPSPLKLTYLGMDSIKQMKHHLTLIGIMCNPCLAQSHWEEMSSITGYDMMPNAGTCLQNYVDYNIEGQLSLFEIISVGAVREAALKESFEKMKSEWKDMHFRVSKHNNTDIVILASVDDIQALLDDHMIRTLAMRGSAFVKPVEEEVQAWYSFLKLVNITIEEWCKVQKQWLYLLPIFSSKNIATQLQNEGVLFQSIDQSYSGVMRQVIAEPQVLATAGDSSNLYEVFKQCLQSLEVINAGVGKYLEQKRLVFPRFFFLSNDEMLEILSETSDPRRVQYYLRKCFEGIHSLEFDSESNILKIVSKDNEEVPLSKVVSTSDAKGCVELWLVELEQQMVESVRNQMRLGYGDYSISQRNSWLLRWPGQVVLCISQIYWTSQCHACLHRSDEKIMKSYHTCLQQQLDRTVGLLLGQLSSQNRITLYSLIVLDIHAKDVVLDLFEKSTQGVNDFLWLAQLRYYWFSSLIVQLTNASMEYSYEYLGNAERLVITPLTDRCFRTLIGAYNLHLNGAPEGTAGAGKTETTKDLAKALGVHCLVFNCSEGLDYKSMGKFFKGLAASGAWACFDELNRIVIEVMSVISQQILCIMQAVRNKVEAFDFEGTTLSLNPRCFICITLNPGYHGRSELPDNLKVLFRPVAMIVPDYALIAEVSLSSYGFVNARELSVKIITTYKLCSELLSSQSHYDYGMRAVKAVLHAAAKMKLMHSGEDEFVLVLRSIFDVNLPTFTSYDVPLFNGIVADLFPGVKHPQPNYKDFYSAIELACTASQLQANSTFVTKITQIYEMMLMRHGFMLVGDPFGGKTESLNVLAHSLSDMEKKGLQEYAVKYVSVNPKAVTLDQLYGSLHPVSNEWSDGIIPAYFREFAMDLSPMRKWIVFDGPVDAEWVENINTVLDDNKKLCLNSGEVIQMTPFMSMVFEVMDLKQASPATVSRCGMIYFEPKTLGWRCLAESWSNSLPEQWTKDNPQRFIQILDWMIEPALKVIKNLNYVIDGGLINHIWTCLKVIEIHLKEAQASQTDLSKTYIAITQAASILGLIWGFGGSLDQPSMEIFNEFVKHLWEGKNNEYPIPGTVEPIEIAIPTDGLLIDYYYNFQGKGGWKYYPDNIKSIKLDDKSNLQTLLVPTLESTRFMDMLEQHCKNGIPVLISGPTGTGKSFFIHNLLMKKLSKTDYSPAFITFTSSTTASLTQELVLNELMKKRRGVFGNVPGKRTLLFIDDIGMPLKEKSSVQPPIELLRQYFDHGYWFDLKVTSKLVIEDLLIVAAMGLPAGGRQNVEKRFLRHFALYSTNVFTDESLTRIFQTILTIGLRRNGFPNDILTTAQQIVAATLLTYKEACSNFFPTPSKSHYVFNLRDFSRVINGHLLIKKESVDSKKVFVRLWTHEVSRVFYDRLLDRTDRAWFLDCIRKRIDNEFKEDISLMLDGLNEDPEDKSVTEETLRNLIFTTILDKDSEEEKRYEEIPTFEAFHTVCNSALNNYNQSNNTTINIILFRYALEHLSRICRILTLSGGCGLLVGVGGCGRQSLVKLAAKICEQSLFQPEITRSYGLAEWKNDVKTLLKSAGGKGKHVVFLLSEEQMKNDHFLQDVDALLKSGDVPNLYAVDEKQEILDMTRLAAQGGNRNMDISTLSVFSFFINRCKQNLHIMLCCSPIGSSLRNKLRIYPSLVNCCTIDWYELPWEINLNGKELTLMGWPEDALEMIAKKFLVDVAFEESIKDSVVKASIYFHISSRLLAERFYENLGKTVYITSCSYLELIKAYTSIISVKQHDLIEAKKRYLGGLEKLEFAAGQVTIMQHDLELLEPQLKVSVEETQEMLNGVEKERLIVDEASAQVREDEKAANEQAEAAVALKIECENDLALAIPILEDATAALNTLKPADITLVKSMKNPPDAVKLVMAAVCVMKDVKARRIPDPKNPGRKIHDYWGPSKRILGDMGFLQSLKDYDKDDIAPHIIQVIRKRFIEHPDFRPQVVAKASSAAEGLCKWVLAMEKYDVVVKMVAPKKKKLAQAERDYAKTKALLDSKRNELSELEKRLADLNLKLETALAVKMRLQNEVELCSNRLKKAQKIVGNLGGEKVRWLEEVEELENLYHHLPGDVLLSCGIVAYLAPFTIHFRDEQIKNWTDVCIEMEIPVSDGYSFLKNLGSEIKIHSWSMNGLPTDPFCIDNAIIMDTSSRWPLFIDPQGQANKWIKSMEHELKVVKLQDSDYMSIIKHCVEYGKPLLFEHVLEDLDPTLEPILLKRTFMQGSRAHIKLGENTLPYSPNFRLYMTTKLRNPLYTPQLFNKVIIINFSLTFGGLSDRLLGIVVGKERPDLQEKRDELIVEGAANRVALQDTEDEILKVLSSVKGNILEDEGAVNSLDISKALAVEIIQKQLAAKENQQTIEEFRLQYKPISDFSANLYYTIIELPNVNPMYQYSLTWFINVYTVSIDLAGKSKIINTRLTFLKEAFIYNLYINVSRSLFDRDKILYSFMVCTSIMIFYNELSKEALNFLLTGGTVIPNETPHPGESWIDNKSWDELCRLKYLPGFDEIVNHFTTYTADWRTFHELSEPGLDDLPEGLRTYLHSDFQKLLVFRVFRPDRIVSLIYEFVTNRLGAQYVAPPPFDLNKSFKNSKFNSPLIFLLSPSFDPVRALVAFAHKMDYTNKFKAISLGQGQGPLAEELIKSAQLEGHWVCLQNCHLSISWLPTLEKICDCFDPANSSPYFRLWLTSYPTPMFPESILQNGVKITNEAPTGLKQNLARLYNSEPVNTPQFYESCQGKDAVFAKLLFGLSFFHAVVLERKRFGSIGWNNPYGFNESDYLISIEQLKMYLKQYCVIPYDSVLYLTGECNYGGRVTDFWDRRVLNTLLSKYINQDTIFTPNYNLAPPNEAHNMPIKHGYSDFIRFIKNLPRNESSEIYGLHSNAGIQRRLEEFKCLMDSMVLVSERKRNPCANEESVLVTGIVEDILIKLPPPFDIATTVDKYPLKCQESMNAVLVQEMKRFNLLIKVINKSLQQLKEGIQGKMVMIPELEAISRSLFKAQVPQEWRCYSYPSLKRLGPYIQDLLERLAFLNKWFNEGPPSKYWLSGFYFTQGFLTGTLQNYAHQSRISLDQLDFDFQVIDSDSIPDDKNGAFVYGLFLEGASWDVKRQHLTEQFPKVFWDPLPLMWIKPCLKLSIVVNGRYTCPLYRTSQRRGAISTIGHSTNYVLPVLLEIGPANSSVHWILRGAALLCETDS